MAGVGNVIFLKKSQMKTFKIFPVNPTSESWIPDYPILSCIMSIAFVWIRNFSLKPFLEKMVKILNFNLEVVVFVEEEGNVSFSKKGD